MADDRPLLLDVTRLIWRRWVGRLPTGIDRVCLAYLDEYRDRAQAVIQRHNYRRILSTGASDRLFDLLSAPGPLAKARLVRLLAAQWLRQSLPGRRRLYLNVGHTALQDPDYLGWTRSAGVRPVYMVHDLIPITHPQYCRAGEAERHADRMRNILASAVGVIGNSQATLDSLRAFAAGLSMGMPAELAAPLGNEIRPARLGKSVEPGRPTFVVLGTIEARKNHLMLLRVWERLIAALGDAAPLLLIIGQRGWECDDVFALLDGNASLRRAVIEVGRCTDEELSTHLAKARALLFPSLAEGYGLPLVEALSSGVPVIASDLPVFREIGQGIPEFLLPEGDVAWEAIIREYALPESAARQAQKDRMPKYRSPTWAGHFASVNTWLAAL